MYVPFRLLSGRDDDIIKWLRQCGKRERSFYIRKAIRLYLQQEAAQEAAYINGPGPAQYSPAEPRQAHAGLFAARPPASEACETGTVPDDDLEANLDKLFQ